MITEAERTEQQAAYLDQFVNAYAEAMLWANTTIERDGEATDESVEPAWWQEPRSGWQLRAFDEDGQASILADCEDFVTSNWDDLRNLDPAQCGHDFALTRNHHGAGFWDRGLGEVGERLTAASHPYGESNAYTSEDDPQAHLL